MPRQLREPARIRCGRFGGRAPFEHHAVSPVVAQALSLFLPVAQALVYAFRCAEVVQASACIFLVPSGFLGGTDFSLCSLWPPPTYENDFGLIVGSYNAWITFPSGSRI